MGRCPMCEQTIPAAEDRCEFCGADLRHDTGPARPGLSFVGRRIGSLDPPPTVDPLSASVPDLIPDDLVRHYGEEARQTVRYRRSVRYRWNSWSHPAIAALRTADLWLLTLLLFGCGIIAFAFIGGLVYAVMLAPWVGLYVVLPMVLLFSCSLLASIRITARRRGEPDGPGR